MAHLLSDSQLENFNDLGIELEHGELSFRGKATPVQKRKPAAGAIRHMLDKTVEVDDDDDNKEVEEEEEVVIGDGMEEPREDPIFSNSFEGEMKASTSKRARAANAQSPSIASDMFAVMTSIERPKTANEALRLLKKRHPKLSRPATSSGNRSRGMQKQRLVERVVLGSIDTNRVNAAEDLGISAFPGSPPPSPPPPPPIEREYRTPATTAAGEKHTLSFEKRQEFIPPSKLVRVECPHCSRKFNPEAAQRHVAICANNKSKPKPPPKELHCFTDRLGVRRGGRGGLASAARERPDSAKDVTAVTRKNSFSSSSHSAQHSTSGSAPAQSTHATSSSTTSLLSRQWGEIMFLLRKPITSNAELAATWRSARAGREFLCELEETAWDLGVLQGTLSRWLLPYDNETSISDQADYHGLGSPELDELMSNQQRRRLVSAATNLRSLIRVKIADNADLQQARASVEAIDKFMVTLHNFAKQRGRNSFKILKSL